MQHIDGVGIANGINRPVRIAFMVLAHFDNRSSANPFSIFAMRV